MLKNLQVFDTDDYIRLGHLLLEEYLTFIRRFDQDNLNLVIVYFNELRENNSSKKLDSMASEIYR